MVPFRNNLTYILCHSGLSRHLYLLSVVKLWCHNAGFDSTFKAKQSLVIALVLSWLDYCNSVLVRLPVNFDPASAVGSKRCSMANFWAAPFWADNGRASQSSLASCSRAYPLESSCIHLPSSECQCASVPDGPTSPESLTYHLDWDSDRPPPTNWLFRLTTSLLSAGGSFQFLPPVSGTVSLHISPQHRRSRFSGSVLRLFSVPALVSYPDSVVWHSTFTFCCGPSSNFVIQTTLTPWHPLLPYGYIYKASSDILG